jgi:hypothetical protein
MCSTCKLVRNYNSTWLFIFSATIYVYHNIIHTFKYLYYSTFTTWYAYVYKSILYVTQNIKVTHVLRLRMLCIYYYIRKIYFAGHKVITYLHKLHNTALKTYKN